MIDQKTSQDRHHAGLSQRPYPVFFVLLTWLVASPVFAAVTVDELVEQVRGTLPVPGTVLIDPGAPWGLAGDDTADAGIEVIDAPESPTGRASRVVVPGGHANAWDFGLLTARNTEPIRTGDVIFLSFWVRCERAESETQEGHLSARLQLGQEPWTGIVDIATGVGAQWKRVVGYAEAARDFAPNDVFFTLHLGALPQTLDIGPAVVLNLGQGVDMEVLPVNRVDYTGRAPDAAWRAAAQERIEQHRMGDLRVRVLDGDRQPVAGAQVHVQMRRHAYHFGTFVGYSLLQETEDGEKMRQFVLDNFNTATTPVYWTDWGWANPANRPTYLSQAAWLYEHHIPTRGHNVIWPGWRWMPSHTQQHRDNPELLEQLIETHFVELLTRFAPYRLAWYDLVNEPRENHDVQDVIGHDVMARWFELAHELAPGSAMFLNDYGILVNGGRNTTAIAAHHREIKNLLDADAPLGGIGFQCHFGGTLTDPQRVIDILDEFARYGLPLHATEFDINVRDEPAQADYTRDFLTAFFSHPATEAFIMWGFWEGDHWRPDAAMVRTDWSPRPNFEAYRDLVYRQWWTDETLTTDAEGVAAVRGFLGEYTVSVTAGDKAVEMPATLTHDGTELTFVIGE